MKRLILISLLILLFAVSTDARVYKISYTEPSTNEDGSPLADLAFCSLFYKIPGGSEIKDWDNTATSLTGGGSILDKPTSDIAVTPAQVEQVDFRMNCTDLTGLFSVFTENRRLQLRSSPPIGIIIR